MIKIVTSFNSSIPSVRKVSNWLKNDPFHVWKGRDRLVAFFILAGDDAAFAFLPVEDLDLSEQDEGLRIILEATHQQEIEKRDFYKQVYMKLTNILDMLDDLNLQLLAISKETSLDDYTQVEAQVNHYHSKLLDFMNDVFVWRDHKEMGALLGEIQPAATD